MGSSQIRSELFRSQVLQGNALGDPSERLVHVVLPAGYADGDERFPVVFLLAGFTGTGASFLKYEAWEEDILQRMDRLVAGGRVRPMILILPDAMTRFGGAQYINSSATGRYQDYLLELVDWTDHTFRTEPRREARAIAGKSSGGFGAVRMAMDHPEAFGLVGDHSGDKYFDYCYFPELPRFHRRSPARAPADSAPCAWRWTIRRPSVSSATTAGTSISITATSPSCPASIARSKGSRTWTGCCVTRGAPDRTIRPSAA